MSTWNDHTIACPGCSAEVVIRVAHGLSATRLPNLHDQIRADALHRFTCAACQERFEVRLPLVYTDFARGIWIEVRLPEEIAAWRTLAPRCEQMFASAVERGAPILRERTHRALTRIVFGYEELREKLLLVDAGIDDIAVECLKLGALRRDPSLLAPSARWFVRDYADGRFTIVRRPDGASFELRASEDELAGLRAEVEPAIQPPFSDPFVSLNRAFAV